MTVKCHCIERWPEVQSNLILTPILDCWQYKAFTCTAGMSTNQAHDVTQFEEKSAVILCRRLWLILETVSSDTLVVSVCNSISSWVENWDVSAKNTIRPFSLSCDNFWCSTASWQMFLRSKSLSYTPFRDIVASIGAARHACALMWLMCRSRRHLNAAETAYKRVMPPLAITIQRHLANLAGRCIGRRCCCREGICSVNQPFSKDWSL